MQKVSIIDIEIIFWAYTYHMHALILLNHYNWSNCEKYNLTVYSYYVLWWIFKPGIKKSYLIGNLAKHRV